MCGKCWLTHRCCRHMETQQIHLEGCPGSLLSPHRCLPPGGTWAGSRSSSQGFPGCPWSLTSEPEWQQRTGDNCVCPSLMPKMGPDSSRALGVYESLVSGLSLNGCEAKSADWPNQTISHQSSQDPEMETCLKRIAFKMSSRIHSSSLNIVKIIWIISAQILYWLANWTARLFTFLPTSSNHRYWYEMKILRLKVSKSFTKTSILSWQIIAIIEKQWSYQASALLACACQAVNTKK